MSYREKDILDGVASGEAVNGDYVLFVHGWRMKEQEKKDFAYTAFKRLYWSGYQGRFGFMTWPTGWFDKEDYLYDDWSSIMAVIDDLSNYNDSDAKAKLAGAKLAEWMPSLTASGGRLHLIAHSMGNVVVSEALKHAPANFMVESYVASQAAEVAGAYDFNAPDILHRRKKLDGEGEVSDFEKSWQTYHLYDFSSNSLLGRFMYPPDLYRDVEKGRSGIVHGPTDIEAYREGEQPHDRYYYAGISAKSIRIVNAYNRGDAALRAWELVQMIKPAFSTALWENENYGDWDYTNDAYGCFEGFNFIANCAIAQERITVLGGVRSTYLHGNVQTGYDYIDGILQLAGVGVFDWTPNAMAGGAYEDNVEILTHVIPSRTHALGQVGSVRGELGGTTINLRTYDNSNQGHSGQFYSSLAERKFYWEQSLALGVFSEDAESVPVSCLAGWVDATAGECGRP